MVQSLDWTGNLSVCSVDLQKFLSNKTCSQKSPTLLLQKKCFFQLEAEAIPSGCFFLKQGSALKVKERRGLILSFIIPS